MLGVIKEYLVSLGYKVDMPSYNQFKGSMNQAEKTVTSFSNTSIAKYAAAGAAITAFVGTAVGAMYKFTAGVAEAELKNEMFARKMWMSNDAALAFKSSLDALGVSVQDLYLSPELMNKFVELRRQATRMELPGGDFENTMKSVRSVTFEFQRLKLEGTYAMYWIGYYLSKYLAGPMFGMKGGLKEINDWLEKNMPKYTQKIAAFLGNVYKLLNAGVIALKTSYEYFNKLTPAAKAFLAVFAAGALGFINPLTLILAGLAGILLLIDDYNTWKNGGMSAWGDTWKELSENGDLDRLNKSVSDLVRNLNALLDINVGQNGENTWIGELINGVEYLVEMLNKTVGLLKTIKEGEFGVKRFDGSNNGQKSSAGTNIGDAILNGITWFLQQTTGTDKGLSEIETRIRKSLVPSFMWKDIPESRNKNISYTISPTYHITSTADGVSLARAIDDKNLGLVTRTQKGVIV